MGIPEEGGEVIIKKIDVERRAWLKNLFGWPYTVSFWWKNGRASYFICFLLPPTYPQMLLELKPATFWSQALLF